ncbi:MAG: WbqC family protein [Bacteroidetes bacterium]|nr:WbqC family protein [Bacteroidota bacterium]
MNFSTAYFPPVSYIKTCLDAGEITIEQHEHFVKQTYRNRCHIYNSNGLLPLIIPVEHDHLGDKPIRDVKISFGAEWKKNHWRSIYSAYKMLHSLNLLKTNYQKLFIRIQNSYLILTLYFLNPFSKFQK